MVAAQYGSCKRLVPILSRDHRERFSRLFQRPQKAAVFPQPLAGAQGYPWRSGLTPL
jgi:hypothetical protein